MLAVGFIPRLHGTRNPRRVSDGSFGERFAKGSGLPRGAADPIRPSLTRRNPWGCPYSGGQNTPAHIHESLPDRSIPLA